EYWQGVRISGYGIDEGRANQTQQTHSGPLRAKTGTRLDYAVESRVGTSGSPVVDPRNDLVLGIHTSGQCTARPDRLVAGTAIDSPELVLMLEGGPVGACQEHEFCRPDALWIEDGATSWSDLEPIDAWYDGANCYVHPLGPTDGEPFIADNRAFYVTPGPNGVCEQGWFDDANCLLGYAPEWRTPFYWNGAFYYIE
ncbi:MAG: hypothetical protein AAF725_26025, partial [Acidobacteriota bacterium]